MKTGATIPPKASLEEAQANLEQAVRDFVKKYVGHPYGTKLNELRRPLLQLKIARKP